MLIYEALWNEENEDGELETKTFLAQTRYLAKHYCGAPQGTKVFVRARYIMLNL